MQHLFILEFSMILRKVVPWNNKQKDQLLGWSSRQRRYLSSTHRSSTLTTRGAMVFASSLQQPKVLEWSASAGRMPVAGEKMTLTTYMMLRYSSVL
jgi:hypothetical protein